MPSLKLADADGALRRSAAQRGITQTKLAQRYVDEGLRMDAYPGLTFRDGPGGRRAALATGPDVWQIVDIAHAFAGQEGALQQTADWLDLPPTLVQTALAYYSEHRDEVDALISRNARALITPVAEPAR